MALKNLKYIQFDEASGGLYSAGKRSLLVPADFIPYLDGMLADLAGHSSLKILLYKIGRALGEGYAKTLKKILDDEKIELNKETLIRESYNAISMEAGWGLIAVAKLDLEKEKIIVKLKNPPAEEISAKSEFSLEAGILSGAYKKLTEKDLFFSFNKKDEKEGALIFESHKKIPKEFLAREKMILIERKDLKEQINKKTHELENNKRALLNILEDIDEAKNKIAEEKNKTLSVITNFSDGLIVFEKDILEKGNKIILVNPQAELIIGVKADEIIGKSAEDLFSLDILKELKENVFQKGEKIIRKELKINEILIVEISIIPLIINNVKTGSLFVIHDISREKEVEKIKSEFVSTAAHQLRTPLSAIKWTLQMIISGDLGLLTPEQKTFLMQGYQSNERMIKLVNDLLDAARIEEGRFGYQFSLIQLEDLIQNTIQDFTHKIKEKKINFIYKKPPKLSPKVNIDPAKMRLVLGNLIDNAIKYTPEKGGVTIAVKYSKLNLEISIKDSGIGIPSSQQKRLFTKFFRSENAIRSEAEGTGLGLFIAKNIVERHGGKIWVETKENKGTTFYFTIPIVSSNKNFNI